MGYGSWIMGSVVFSVDAELGWGFSDFDQPPASRIDGAREGWRTLLAAFESNDVPATWAVVGHLFLDSCDGRHADHPSIPGWFDRERGAWNTRPDLRFGRDLITEVTSSPVSHDIACHSFSHVLFGDPETTHEIAYAELAAAVDAAAAAGIEFESFVFPRNSVGHRELLSEFGFRCYRGARSEPAGRLQRTVHKLRMAARTSAVGLETPTIDEYGLVNVPPSLYLFGFEGWPRGILTALWDDPVVSIAKRGIDRACNEDGLFHLWLHPNNILGESDRTRVGRIVEYAAAKRDTTDLRIETMADVAARVLEDPLSQAAAPPQQ
jgi:peptidoglycan/xylan/chitin deacetylase (PgdA/CDA1 family)